MLTSAKEVGGMKKHTNEAKIRENETTHAQKMKIKT